MSGWDEPVSFGEVWDRAVADGPDRTFLVFEGPDEAVNTWSYEEFNLLVARAGGRLREHGVGQGDAVHLALTNSPGFVAIWIACARLGAWIVPSDPMGQAPELAEHIGRTRPKVGISSTARADTYAKAVSEAGSPVAVVEVDERDCDLTVFGRTEAASWPQLDPRDRAAVMFTSGTTGRPKGVDITQANYAFAGKVMAEAAGLTADHRQLVVLPLFHANAQYYSFASAIWAGASVALMSTFSASGFLGQAARHRATHASLFAAPIRMILARGATPADGVALAHCWFAQNIADAQYETLGGLLGCRPRQLYGMTETIPAVLTDRADAPVPSSIGFVTPGCSVEIQRSDGSLAEPDEEGEIVVAGEPGITLFAGYLDDPATTEASFRAGWFLTGDRATRDAEGRHRFVGRRSDVLKVAGENVSTVEVEQVLAAHPGVLEAAVVGTPDPVRDEVPVAFVVAADPDAPPSLDELERWCEARLGKAKRPREITFLDELPRTSVGKIRKFVLKETP
jgi:carnitine-CoA ligase